MIIEEDEIILINQISQNIISSINSIEFVDKSESTSNTVVLTTLETIENCYALVLIHTVLGEADSSPYGSGASITINGNSMSYITDTGFGNRHSQIWGKAMGDLSVGIQTVIAVPVLSPDEQYVSLLLYKKVKQISSIVDSDSGNGSGTASLTLSVTNGQKTVDCLASDNSPSVGVNQIQRTSGGGFWCSDQDGENGGVMTWNSAGNWKLSAVVLDIV